MTTFTEQTDQNDK